MVLVLTVPVAGVEVPVLAGGVEVPEAGVEEVETGATPPGHAPDRHDMGDETAPPEHHWHDCPTDVREVEVARQVDWLTFAAQVSQGR
jgi:hypothetical protein